MLIDILLFVFRFCKCLFQSVYSIREYTLSRLVSAAIVSDTIAVINMLLLVISAIAPVNPVYVTGIAHLSFQWNTVDCCPGSAAVTLTMLPTLNTSSLSIMNRWFFVVLLLVLNSAV